LGEKLTGLADKSAYLIHGYSCRGLALYKRKGMRDKKKKGKEKNEKKKKKKKEEAERSR
jgi:hypothetical protein